MIDLRQFHHAWPRKGEQSWLELDPRHPGTSAPSARDVLAPEDKLILRLTFSANQEAEE